MFRLISTLVLLASPAFAQTIYRWTDGHGIVHYTDDAATAPKGVKVETTEGDELNDVTVSKDTKATKVASNEQLPVPPPPSTANQRDDEEDYWRNEFARAKDKIKSIETDVAIDERRLGDPSSIARDYSCAGAYAGYDPNAGSGRQHLGPYGNAGSPVPGNTVQVPPSIAPRYGYLPYYCDFARVRDRLEANKAALARAREEMTDLERRAANAAVPLEWRR